ncbi:MAG: sensor histidine kinase KdpD [Phycisphaerales bacterium]|nr:sensor histidine kinase KdpD [Phycisphaerales bacterium]
MPDARPDPAELLARIQRDDARVGGESGGSGSARGKLKIFFGMAPGVGKTYAMLAAAQRMAAQGVDVVAGVVETHGRVETEQMLLGLDILPRRKVEYSGTTLHEFDAEAAILRRPDILLVDEFAHTNAPGSTREKRWQDVQACLKAGVNVYTTLNVQHLESINDVVTQITGVVVRETVPDSAFDEADEIELVDLPTGALHERLRAGKVYLGDNAARAVDPSDGFFRKGNLTALRELALRRTAAWVDGEMRRYKQDRGIRGVWAAGERILVAVSPSPLSGKLIRAAKRMAAGLHAELIAVHVETPRTANLSPADRERLTQNMRLAESLGATTSTLVGENAARTLIGFARARNVGKIVVGKTERPRWREIFTGSFIDSVIRESGDIDVYVVRGDDALPAAPGRSSELRNESDTERVFTTLGVYATALFLVGAVTGIGVTIFAGLDLANIAMVYLAAVVVSAIWLGRGPAMLAAAAGVAAFDFCFVSPRWSFAVSDVQYLLTFAVMLAVGLVVGTLAARTRTQARVAWDRERRTAALYALSRELALAQNGSDVATVAARHAHDLLGADVIVAVPVQGRPLQALDVLAFGGSPDWFDDPAGRERGVAKWALDHAKPAGLGTQTLPASAGRYMPLVGTSGKLAVLGLRPVDRGEGSGGAGGFDASAVQLIDALANQIASALERVSLSESQQAAKLEAERERLRSALLSSVSHDLRTPLASITGAASTLQQSMGLVDSNDPGPSSQHLDADTRAALLRTIIDESSRLNDIIANLVFATRLESGAIALRREWTTLEEITGAGLARHRADLAARPFRIHLPPDLPMVRVDNAMLPQVVHNLIENAIRYTPPGTPISLSAWTADGQMFVRVTDEGPGLADDESAKVFQRFYRGRASKSGSAAGGSSPSSTGMGLGLTICEGIIRTHGGRIWAEPNTPRGVAFMFSLPVEHPQPSMPSELAEQTNTQGGSA